MGLLPSEPAGDRGRFLLAIMLLLLLPEAPGRRLETLVARELHTDLALSRTALHDRFCGSADPGLLTDPRPDPPADPSPSWSRHRDPPGAPLSPSGVAGTDRLLLMSFLNSDSVMVLICSMLISACCPEVISAISVSAILSKSSEDREVVVVVGAGASVLVGASKETDLQQAGKEGRSVKNRKVKNTENYYYCC